MSPIKNLRPLHKVIKYKGYLLETKFENGNSVTTVSKNMEIVSMTYSSPLDKKDSEEKTKDRINGKDKTGIYKF